MPRRSRSQPPTRASIAFATACLLGLAFLASLAGCSEPTPDPAAAPATITPAELLGELMGRPTDVAVLDLRPRDAFAQFHLPDAKNVSPMQLRTPELAAVLEEQRLIVLCGPAAAGAAASEALADTVGDRLRVLDGDVDRVRTIWLEAASDPSTPPLFALQRAFLRGVDGDDMPAARYATDPDQLRQPTMVSVDWLDRRLGEVTVLDVRDQRSFGSGHVPGAVNLQLDRLRRRIGNQPVDLAAADDLARCFGELGLTCDTAIVITSHRLLDATLAALALERLGHQRLAVLEGGLLRWAAERRPLVRTITTITPAEYVPRTADDYLAITTDEVAATLAGRDPARILDVRPAANYRGERSPAARVGHIPSARNRAFTTDVIESHRGQWLQPQAELLAAYEALGATPDTPVVVTCRTGHAASQTYFVLHHLLGYTNVRWHGGSWTEWAARQDLPIATGDR